MAAAMNLSEYLNLHDGKPRPDGPELIRLAHAAGLKPYFLYMVALGHKRVGPEKALALHRSSIGGQLKPEVIRDDVDWQRNAAGEVIAWITTPRVA